MKIQNKPVRFLRGREGLDEYVHEFRDRGVPPYYAGRQKILSEIEDACAAIWKRHQDGRSQTEGLTRVIYGAPGAGKSSTLVHLHDEWLGGSYVSSNKDGSDREGPAPVMVYSGDGSLFHSIGELCQGLIDLVSPENSEDIFAMVSETVRRKGGLDFPIVNGEIENEKTIVSRIAHKSLSAIAKLLPPEKWTRPVVLGVDEAQNLSGDKDSPTGKLLQALHSNSYNLPILVVLAGLSDSVQRVKELGVSRLSSGATYSLECLNTAEIEQLKLGFCNYFQIDFSDHMNELEALLEKTDGWPAHIQNCLRAFAEVYLDVDCDINRVDFTEVEKRSQAVRMEYYHARISTSMGYSAQLLGLLMEKLTGKEHFGHVIGLIKRLDHQNQGSDDITLSLPDDRTAREFYEELLHCGALQERRNQTVFCPIPSFRQYMIEVGRKVRDEIGMQRAVPYYFGLPKDSIDRIEAAHEIPSTH